MAADSVLKQLSDERAALALGALPAAVAVGVGRRRILSGIRWRDDLVVTAAEAIGGADHVDVRVDGDNFVAEVVATDLTTDIAVLRVGSGSAADTEGVADDAGAGSTGAEGDDAVGANVRAAVGAIRAPANVAGLTGAGAAGASGARSGTASRPTHRATTLRVGESILVVGRNLRGPAAIWGAVQLAGPAWNSRRGGKIDQRIELDVRFDPSFEGGAVIDTDGNIVAMAVAGIYDRVLGIPTATIDNVVAKVEKFGHLPRPYIGIRLQPLWLDDDTRSKLGRKSRGIAAVGGVDAGSPAAEAHIELGDLLLTLDGDPAESVNSLAQRIAGTSPGQTIAVEVLRGGKPLTIHVQIGERPRH